MERYIISQFIDDELSLDEKCEFIGKIHGDPAFREDALQLLAQERIIRGEVAAAVPRAASGQETRRLFSWGASLVRSAGLIAASIVLIAAFSTLVPVPPQGKHAAVYHRFVIFEPAASQVEITGTFTGWQKKPLARAGESGYWEVTLSLPEGEHRYVYLIEGTREYADPTVSARERDDFGGENSVLMVRA